MLCFVVAVVALCCFLAVRVTCLSLLLALPVAVIRLFSVVVLLCFTVSCACIMCSVAFIAFCTFLCFY